MEEEEYQFQRINIFFWKIKSKTVEKEDGKKVTHLSISYKK